METPQPFSTKGERAVEFLQKRKPWPALTGGADRGIILMKRALPISGLLKKQLYKVTLEAVTCQSGGFCFLR